MNTLMYMTFLHIFLGLDFVSNEQFVTSEIDAVTVYANSARVTRLTDAQVINADNTVLVLEKLSPFIDQASIQVLLEGEGTINAVKFRKNYSETEVSEEQMINLVKLGQLKRDSIALIDLRLRTIMARKDFLDANMHVKGEYMTMTLKDLSDINDYYTEELEQIFIEQFDLKNKKEVLQAQITIMNRQAHELKPDLNQVPYDLLVNVSPNGSEEVSLKVIYKVSHAGWFTSYDMRATAIDQPITLVQKANVFQHTGEDWSDVSLSFSNENTSNSKTLPRLYPQYLPPKKNQKKQSYQPGPITKVSGHVYDLSSKETIPFATVHLEGTAISTDTDFEGFYELVLPPNHKGTLKVSFLGYTSKRIQFRTSEQDFYLNESGEVLDEIVITGYKVPLIDIDETSQGGVLTSKSIRKLPSRNIAEMTATTAGLSNINGQDVNIKGSRDNSTYYYIDGVRVKGEYKESIPEIRIEESVLNFKFTLDSPYTVLSDGKNNEIALRPIELDAAFVYRAVPRLSTSVYLTAYIDEWEDKNLTTGNMNLYFEGAYIGQSLLDPNETQDSMILSLGVDSKISIKRERTKSLTKKIALSSKKCTEVAYAIEIKNQKLTPLTIEVWDQIPISLLKEIEVNDVMFSDRFELDAATGIGHWKVDLSTKESKTLDFNYAVKYPNRFHFQL